MALSPAEVKEALEASAKAPGLDQFVGQTLVFEDYDIDRGQYGDYAEVRAVTEEGNSTIINTGSKVILNQLAKMKELDAFPFEAVVASYPTRFGNDGYKLEVA